MSETFTSRYGGTFTTAAERDAWDAYIKARLEAAMQSRVLTPEETEQRFKALLESVKKVHHTVA